MHLIDCHYELHGDAILDIFNDVIINTTALYEHQPRDQQTIKHWFDEKQRLNFPIIGAIDETGRLPQVGYKFERWLDLVFLQKQLN